MAAFPLAAASAAAAAAPAAAAAATSIPESVARCISLATKINTVCSLILRHPTLSADYKASPEMMASLRQDVDLLDSSVNDLLSKMIANLHNPSTSGLITPCYAIATSLQVEARAAFKSASLLLSNPNAAVLMQVKTRIHAAMSSAAGVSPALAAALKAQIEAIPDRSVKDRLDGKYYEFSTDPHKDAWGMGGAAKHIVDDLPTTLVAIERLLEEIIEPEMGTAHATASAGEDGSYTSARDEAAAAWGWPGVGPDEPRGAGAGAGAGNAAAVADVRHDETVDVHPASPAGQIDQLRTILEKLKHLDGNSEGWEAEARSIVEGAILTDAVIGRVYGHIWRLAGKPEGDKDYGQNHAYDSLDKLREAVLDTWTDFDDGVRFDAEGGIEFTAPL